jgi:hypothetical protein
MDRAHAEQYVLALVNRDREAEGLDSVVWDDTAERAGQRHAEDMARHGYTAHGGTDGSVPELRYTQAGGAGFVQENAGCFFDGNERVLDPHPTFDAEALEKVEAAFMDEVPPHDGHRRNILTAWHNRFGVGLAQPVGLRIPCMAEEFVDSYGRFDPVPSRAKVGQKIRVSGEVSAPAVFAGVGLARVEAPRGRSVAELNATHSYAIPQPYVNYFPKGFVTPIPVRLIGNKFAIDVPLDDHGHPGLYEVSIWARLPASADLVMISLRTALVD